MSSVDVVGEGAGAADGSGTGTTVSACSCEDDKDASAVSEDDEVRVRKTVTVLVNEDVDEADVIGPEVASEAMSAVGEEAVGTYVVMLTMFLTVTVVWSRAVAVGLSKP